MSDDRNSIGVFFLLFSCRAEVKKKNNKKWEKKPKQ
jgi:hypothetical protein